MQMSLEGNFMNVDSKYNLVGDQVTFESISSCSLKPPFANTLKEVETSETQSTSFRKSSEECEPSSDCTSKESFTESCDKTPLGQDQRESSTMKKQQENYKMSQEELKRERNRRLAREFRARKKEEIRLYRSTIVNLTQKVRTLAAENQKLQQIVKEIQGKTTDNAERKAEKHKDEQIHKLQKQILLYQILLQRLKDSNTQELWRQRGTQQLSPESYSSPLPPIKTLTQMECVTTESLCCSPDQELQQRRLPRSCTVPSLTDIPLSNLVTQQVVESEARSRRQSLDNYSDSGITESSFGSPPNNLRGFHSHSLYAPITESPLVYRNLSDIWDSKHS